MGKVPMPYQMLKKLKQQKPFLDLMLKQKDVKQKSRMKIVQAEYILKWLKSSVNVFPSIY